MKLFNMQNNQKVKLSGKCTNYNNCDDVWKFMIEKCDIKGETFRETGPLCRIVALDADNNPNKVSDPSISKVPVKKTKKGGGTGKRPYMKR